jgi:hypothetical protein
MPDGSMEMKRILTRTSQDLQSSPLGVTLRHPLAPATEVPIAWQSTIRQPVRNDFPLLACVELGVRHVRVPAGDLANPQQRERLSALRDEGIAVTAFWIWSERCRVVEEAEAHSDLLDGVEIQIPSELLPDASCLEAIQQCATLVPVTLAPLLPREVVAGKQHARTRIGYHADELEALNTFLRDRDALVDRVLCRVDAGESPLSSIGTERRSDSLSSIGALDWAVEFGDADAEGQIPRAVEGMAAVAAHKGARLFLEPLVDLDRTMDTPPGLLDRLCNPRPVFNVVRTLNTILFGDTSSWSVETKIEESGAIAVQLTSPVSRLLVVPQGKGNVAMHVPGSNNPGLEQGWGSAKVIDLVEGTIGTADEWVDIDGPFVAMMSAPGITTA